VYRYGPNRIYYQTSGFVPKTISCFFYAPDGRSTLTYSFTEIEAGIYYADVVFSEYGDYLGVFYENGNRVTTRIFKVTKLFHTFYEGQPLY